jgi:hypothetical protein
VVSPRGCYLCTPLRGQLDKSIGNASTRSLVEIWYSSRHTALMHQPCKLRCTYHEQNELLLAMRAPGRASAPIEPAWLQRGFL